MSPERPEDPEVLLSARSPLAAPASASPLPPPVAQALQRLVDALADEPGGGAADSPTDRVPTAELDEVVRLLGGTDGANDGDGSDGAARAVLLLAHRAVALRLERDNLRVALETNRSISAAVGVLMAMHHLTHDDAFDLLVRVSQHHNRKLRHVAEDVVRTGALPASSATSDAAGAV